MPLLLVVPNANVGVADGYDRIAHVSSGYGVVTSR